MSRTPTAVSVALVAAGSAVLAVAAPALAGPVERATGPQFVYDAGRVPSGATARVHSVETGSGKTIVTLHVSGMTPFSRYGAHAHVSPCGASGGAAGPHYQYRQDPVQPSVDPAYANDENEIWLDLATNAAGEGHAKAVVDWQFPSERRAQSVIIHTRSTSTAPGQAGTAGARVACVSVPF